MSELGPHNPELVKIVLRMADRENTKKLQKLYALPLKHSNVRERSFDPLYETISPYIRSIWPWEAFGDLGLPVFFNKIILRIRE